MSDEPVIIDVDEAVVLPLRGPFRHDPRDLRGPRLTPDRLEKRSLRELQAQEIERLADLPDGKHLGAIARITVMRLLVAIVSGEYKPKSATEATKVMEVAHRIALAEEQRNGGDAPITGDDMVDKLTEIATQARAEMARKHAIGPGS